MADWLGTKGVSSHAGDWEKVPPVLQRLECQTEQKGLDQSAAGSMHSSVSFLTLLTARLTA